MLDLIGFSCYNLAVACGRQFSTGYFSTVVDNCCAKERETDDVEIQELWTRAKDILSHRMNTYTYTAMIQNTLQPERLNGNTLSLVVAYSALKAPLLLHAPLISAALSDAAGQAMECEILTREEADQTPQQRAKEQDRSSQLLNPKYTFDSFVVGPSNRFAHAAAIAVADNPAEVYNPLFIYGGVGLGKTHLMHAIGHRIMELYPGKRLLYITSETFTNDLISAIQQGRNTQFRNHLRNVDVLMVDDIQFIAGKDSTQEEFFHTFNALYNDGKQIILTSDRPPQEIARLEERLRSRFAGGLIADIQRPDLETRIAILREKALQAGRPVPNEVLEMIAGQVQSNIRELEGSYNKLIAYSRLIDAPINEATCREALKELFDSHKRRVITADLVKRTVCEYYAVDSSDLTSSTRRREIAVPRQVAMYLTRELTGMSLPQIGQAFGNRDHSTVMHSISQIDHGMKTTAALSSQVNDIRHMIMDA